MNLAKTYSLQDGPKGFHVDGYVEDRNRKYRSLLETIESEEDLIRFLENNPSFVPGAWTPGTKSGHYPLHCALITRPELKGLTTKIPDFMWVSTHSSGWYPTLIEIENPTKKIFMKKGVPTSDFTQARNQLEQWRTWFNNPSNIHQFMEQYRIPDYMRNERQMKLHMILVYGRRKEFESDANRSKDRMSLMPYPDAELMSCDRLACDRELYNAITIRFNANSRYEAVSVPPTFKLGPNLADRLLHIDGIDEALDKTVDLTPDRRSFLKRRLSYWKDWARMGEKGIIHSGYFE